MFLQEWLTSIRARRRRQQQRIDEEGAEIARRLKELLGETKLKQVETPSTKIRSGNDAGRAYRDRTGT